MLKNCNMKISQRPKIKQDILLRSNQIGICSWLMAGAGFETRHAKQELQMLPTY